MNIYEGDACGIFVGHDNNTINGEVAITMMVIFFYKSQIVNKTQGFFQIWRLNSILQNQNCMWITLIELEQVILFHWTLVL